jgi:hypothetical protein
MQIASDAAHADCWCLHSKQGRQAGKAGSNELAIKTPTATPWLFPRPAMAPPKQVKTIEIRIQSIDGGICDESLFRK